MVDGSFTFCSFRQHNYVVGNYANKVINPSLRSGQKFRVKIFKI